ncbi:MAG: hypothetical protein IJU57_02335 [Clostridia bacterium]|nr:hypothetical protein [Clostridia bacterium]
MLKKSICLILVLIMTAGIFAGCSENSNSNSTTEADVEATSRNPMTLSLWLPTDPSTTEEAIALVSEAINKITQAKYNTAIELHLIPRDEYQETIDAKLDAVKTANDEKAAAEEARRRELRAQKQNGTAATETEETEPAVETTVNEYGIHVTTYPTVPDTQLDIFLVQGFDNYTNYAYSDLIQPIDTELSGSSKIINSYVYPTFIKAIYDFGTFGVPNNHPAGKYQYLLINKELVDEYDYNLRELTSLLRSKNFIIDIGNQHLDDVIPLLGPVDASGMVFLSDHPGADWSLICAQVSDMTKYSDQVIPTSLLDNNSYLNTLKMVKELQSYGYVGDGTLKEGQRFAIGVIEGDEVSIREYEDEYYISVYTKPMFREDDIYGSMLSVCEYSKNVSRAMEIITCINTNPELRTVLQYGVEGVHWEYEDPDTKESIKILSGDYGMDINETGNVFMTYPGEGETMEYWEQYKAHNRETISDPFMKMPSYVNDNNREDIEELLRLNEEYKARFDAITFENFNDEIKKIKAELAENEAFMRLVDPENEDSIIYQYVDWQETTY